MTYADKLRDPRWQKKRLKILERDDWTCQWCGDSKKTLHIHHTKYLKEPWDVEDEFLITVCETCHKSEDKELRKEVEQLIIERLRLLPLTEVNCISNNLRVVPFLLDGLHEGIERVVSYMVIDGELSIDKIHSDNG